LQEKSRQPKRIASRKREKNRITRLLSQLCVAKSAHVSYGDLFSLSPP